LTAAAGHDGDGGLLQERAAAAADEAGDTLSDEVEPVFVGCARCGIGFDPDEVTLYALRHSSIVRNLLLNVPIRVVAASHNTSVAEIERTYSKFSIEHSGKLSRRALLDDQAAQVADNVVPMAA
jgi:hypothetical protein